jgi:hypothetical protein
MMTISEALAQALPTEYELLLSIHLIQIAFFVLFLLAGIIYFLYCVISWFIK